MCSNKETKLISDKYQLERLLGEGSFGKTYLGRDLVNGKQVAIKIIKFAEIEAFKDWDLFQREITTLSTIQVYGVPRFYDGFQDETGNTLYLIQEYIDAPSIQKYIDDGHVFTESEVLTILDKMASILHQLQTNYKPPIVHRDIKPSNILCVLKSDDDSKQIQPWLIDFGSVGHPDLTGKRSTIAGTFGYMAPEQLLGNCTIQSDFYSLGATALYMLTGTPPFEMTSDAFQLKFDDILNEKAPKTSTFLRDLIRMMLQTDPKKRPESALSIREMIENQSLPKQQNKSNLFIRCAQWSVRKFQNIIKLLKAEFNAQNNHKIVTGYAISFQNIHNVHVVQLIYKYDDKYLQSIQVLPDSFPISLLNTDLWKIQTEDPIDHRIRHGLPCQIDAVNGTIIDTKEIISKLMNKV